MLEQKIKQDLIEKKETLISKLISVEKKKSLLTNTIDLDYLETLYRKKFMLGKAEEKVFVD